MKNQPLIRSFILFLFLISSNSSFSQLESVFINKDHVGMTMIDFIKIIEKEYNVSVYFDSDSLANHIVGEGYTFNDQEILLTEYINFLKLNISAYKSSIFITKNELINTSLPEVYRSIRPYGLDRGSGDNNKYLDTDEEYISKEKTVGIKDIDTKKTALIKGNIRSNEEKTPLFGISINVKETDKTLYSNKEGKFNLTLLKGTYTFEISGNEIEPTLYKIHVDSDGELNLYPERTFVAIEEVTILSDKFHNIKSMIIGFEEISSAIAADIPSSLGENDLIKAGLLLPGVQTIGEGNAGINVRGAPSDQNMFYLNGLPLYNTSHFLGFFSSFNPLAIKGLNIYKSSIPIQYGNNLSSVFDISVKDGLTKKYSTSFSLSPITLSVLAEGPIVKDKAGFLVSYRTTYSNWVLSLIDDLDISESKADFKDLLANVAYNINESNKVKLFFYYSDDKINLANNTSYNYQSKGFNVSWDKTIQHKHNLKTNLLYSNYEFLESNFEDELVAYKLPYKLDHYGLNSKLNLHFNDHDVNIGIDNILYMIDQGSVQPYSPASLIEQIDLYKENAFISSLFISDIWKISNNFSFKGAFRINSYNYLGEREINTYEEGLSYKPENVISTTHYDKFERIKSFFHPDFRITANYKINENYSIKAGYNYMYQYLFMMSNTISASPTNKFKLVDQYLDPIKGQQINLGVYSNLNNNKYILSIESYLKIITDYKDFKDGANLVFSEVPEYSVINSNMNTYGIEFMLKKASGKFNGWLNYTYSNSTVLNNNPHSQYDINLGKSYPSNFDKPHSINFVANYKFIRRFTLSANIVYSTGRPLTYPVGLYYQNNIQIPYYTTRNEYRVPDYFRIDLSARIEGNLKQKKLAHGTWIFSVYNVTGRNNTYSVFFKTENGIINGYKMSIFAIPIFSVSYQLIYGNYADKYY